MHLVTGDDYYQQLLTTIPHAKKRIVLAAMVVLSGKQTDRIFALLRDAAQRGVPVTIMVDNYSRLKSVHSGTLDMSVAQRIAHTFTTLAALEAVGATVHYFGKVRVLNPFKGRCHVKITVVDDDFYCFGGINFTDESFQNIDYMFHGAHPRLADRLEQLVARIGTIQPPLPDDDLPLGSTQHLLFDGGKPDDSIIYDQACELASQAIRVLYVSQTAPSGRLAELLHGTDSTCYFNRPLQMQLPGRYAQAFDQQRWRTPNHYTGTRYIHAKFMLCELPGGRKAVLSGSNNFSYRGVAFGTQEIALYSTEPSHYHQLRAFARTHM